MAICFIKLIDNYDNLSEKVIMGDFL